MRKILRKIIFISLFFLLNFNTAHALIIRIVITGGSCSGKSTALPYVAGHFKDVGYNVMTVKEVATSIFLEDGINEYSHSRYDYQTMIAKRQIEEEDKICSDFFAVNDASELLLLFCDRGLLDGKGFMDNPAFAKIIDSLKITEKEIIERYAAVFHLTTVARYDTSCYVRCDTRQENAAQAIKFDDKLLMVYDDHPYRVVIGSFPTMKEKIMHLIEEIQIFLDKNGYTVKNIV